MNTFIPLDIPQVGRITRPGLFDIEFVRVNFLALGQQEIKESDPLWMEIELRLETFARLTLNEC